LVKLTPWVPLLFIWVVVLWSLVTLPQELGWLGALLLLLVCVWLTVLCVYVRKRS